MATEADTKIPAPASGTKRAKPAAAAKAVAAPRNATAPRSAPKPAKPALAKPLSREKLDEMFKLVKGATSVELKLSVPVGAGSASVH